LEFLLLCLVLPGFIIWGGHGQFMFAFLWAATLYCSLIYRFKFFKNWKTLFGLEAVTWENLKPILFRFSWSMALVIIFTYFYSPDRFFALPRERPEIIPAILFIYPLISALPQEFIFCRYFFKRYELFFGSGKVMILASAVIFAFAHVLFINWIAPVFSFLAGLIFAQTYMKTKSLTLVTIEHGLYGAAIFMIGLGYYFYSGSISS
ncbi:MAG: CPBP family intramembrane glutamic endopeptidase, partial [Pseudomonadota bacterium]